MWLKYAWVARPEGSPIFPDRSCSHAECWQNQHDAGRNSCPPIGKLSGFTRVFSPLQVDGLSCTFKHLSTELTDHDCRHLPVWLYFSHFSLLLLATFCCRTEWDLVEEVFLMSSTFLHFIFVPVLQHIRFWWLIHGKLEQLLEPQPKQFSNEYRLTRLRESLCYEAILKPRNHCRLYWYIGSMFANSTLAHESTRHCMVNRSMAIAILCVSAYHSSNSSASSHQVAIPKKRTAVRYATGR